MNIIVWGTGRLGRLMAVYLGKLNTLLQKSSSSDFFSIAYFVDRNPRQEFFKKEVYAPNEVDWKANELVVLIGVAQDKEIISFLQMHKVQYYRYNDVLHKSILVRRHLPLFLRARGFSITKATDLDLTKLKSVYNDLTSRDEENNNLLLDACLLEICDKYLRNGKTIDEMAGEFGNEKVIGTLFNLYAGDEGRAYSVFDSEIGKHCKRRTTVKTIAVYYPEMRNGGVQRVLSYLIPLFLEMGYDVVFLTEKITEEDYPLPPSISKVLLPSQLENRILWIEMFSETLVHYNVDVIYQPDFGTLFVVMATQAMAKLHGILNICAFHSSLFCFTKRKKYVSCYRQMDTVAALDRTDTIFLRMYGVNAIYVPNPICLSDQEREPWTFNEENKGILWVGRFSPEKNIDDIIPIMKNVVRELPEAHLSVLGDAPTGELIRLQREINVNGLSKNISFLGFHANVQEYYKKAGVVIVTSSFEGFSYVIAESKWYGVPLVTYDMPYLELLRDGKGYAAVEHHDYKKMSENVVRLLKDTDLRRKTSKESYDSIEPFLRYDYKGIWRGIIEGKITGTDDLDSDERIATYEIIIKSIVVSLT